MKKLLQGIVFTCAVLTTPLMAQTVTYACQYVESGGFNREDGDWELTNFPLGEPFFLTVQDGSLMPVNLAMLGARADQGTIDRIVRHPLYTSTCKLPKSTYVGVGTVQTCINDRGTALIFNFDELQGATSRLFDSVVSSRDGRRDDISVDTFTCQIGAITVQ